MRRLDHGLDSMPRPMLSRPTGSPTESVALRQHNRSVRPNMRIPQRQVLIMATPSLLGPVVPLVSFWIDPYTVKRGAWYGFLR